MAILNLKLLLLTIMFFLLGCITSFADPHQCVDLNGKTFFTNLECPDANKDRGADKIDNKNINHNQRITKTINYKDGSTYTGEVIIINEGGTDRHIRDGKGKYVWVIARGTDSGKSCYYDGDWKNNQKNGYGVFQCPGTLLDTMTGKHTGNWKNDQMHGEMTMIVDGRLGMKQRGAFEYGKKCGTWKVEGIGNNNQYVEELENNPPCKEL